MRHRVAAPACAEVLCRTSPTRHACTAHNPFVLPLTGGSDHVARTQLHLCREAGTGIAANGRRSYVTRQVMPPQGGGRTSPREAHRPRFRCRIPAVDPQPAVSQHRGILGFVLAALFGAVVSSIAAMLNAASTIFAMDIYRKVKKDASPDCPGHVRAGSASWSFVLIAILHRTEPWQSPDSAASSRSSRSSRASSRRAFWPSSCSACSCIGLRAERGPWVCC